MTSKPLQQRVPRSTEWTKTYHDGAGRRIRIVPAYQTTYIYETWTYNNKSQLTAHRDPDDVRTLYQYNNKGELEYTAADLNKNGSLNLDGPDRVTQTVTTVLDSADGDNPHGVDIIRTDTFLWTDGDTSSSPPADPVSRADRATTGLKSWSSVYQTLGSAGATSIVETVFTGNDRTVTSTNPDGSYVVQEYEEGELQSVTRRDSGGGQLGKTTYGFDAHGRTETVTDARNGATTYAYKSGTDAVETVTTPPPDGVGYGQVTTTTYNNIGQVTSVRQPDGGTANNVYNVKGLLEKTYGSRNYPVEYTYDAQGRMKTMVTWKDWGTTSGSSGSATTTWNYNGYRGWLDNKRDADSKGADYTYTAAGRLEERKWARGGGSRVTTTYSYGFDDVIGVPFAGVV